MTEYNSHYNEMSVSGQRDKQTDVGFRKKHNGIDIVVPRDEQSIWQWGEAELAFTLHAEKGSENARKWDHYVQVSSKDPKRFRVLVEHEHPAQHEKQLFTLEYNDLGQFDQNDPDLDKQLPPEVYQATLGMSVALNEVRDHTQNILEEGRYTQQDGEHIIEDGELQQWMRDEWIYTIAISKNDALESVWEMGFEQADAPATGFRAFARDVESGTSYTLFARDDGEYIANASGLSSILPEAVYSGLFGLAEGAKFAKNLTVEAYRNDELNKRPDTDSKIMPHAERINLVRQQASEGISR